MEFLSVISKGTLHDKLLWAFTFYDLDHDGYISKEEMLKVTDAIHELMGDGSSAIPGTQVNESVRSHVDKVFDCMDTNADGKVSMEEFTHYCNSQTCVKEAFAVLP